MSSTIWVNSKVIGRSQTSEKLKEQRRETSLLKQEERRRDGLQSY
jgi:hypothetical protein